jgi:GntR family transcriptional regulator/MocR family aminotransferase
LGGAGTVFHLFHIERHSDVSLQTQIKQQLVAAIIEGYIPANERLPPSRILARQLDVARNTIVHCYDSLKDEGYLVSRERSGYFINPVALEGRVQPPKPFEPQPSNRPDWFKRLKYRPSRQDNISKPSNWQDYPYPFIYGQIDNSLFPIHSWRECSRDATTVSAIRGWTGDYIDRDDPLLVEQIRTRLLPRRGVRVGTDNILVTVGAQHGLYLIAQLLFDSRTVIGLENPGYVDIRNIASLNHAPIESLSLDSDGLIVAENLDRCDYVYVTPSHQSPTTVTMPIDRRYELLRRASDADLIVIEDDYDSELAFSGRPVPALKSLDYDDRVIYIGSLSKTLAPGLRIGYLVGSSDLVKELRAIRRLMLRHPAVNNQRAAALFLERGHHDSLVRSLVRVYQERAHVLQSALSHYMPAARHTPVGGGSSCWIKAPEGLQARALQRLALDSGVLLEPGDIHFLPPNCPVNYFRLGFSSIATERIQPGIRTLAGIFNNMA